MTPDEMRQMYAQAQQANNGQALSRAVQDQLNAHAYRPAPDHEANLRSALTALAEEAPPEHVALAKHLAHDRGFAEDATLPIATDMDVPAWQMFLGQARKMLLALSGEQDARAESRRRVAEAEQQRYDAEMLYRAANKAAMWQPQGYETLTQHPAQEPPKSLLARLKDVLS